MFYTTRHEGFDQPIHTKRAPTFHEHVSAMIDGLLRRGFGLKLISILGLMLSYYAFQGKNIFTYNMETTTEDMRENSRYLVNNCVWQMFGLLGSMNLAFFQICVSDDIGSARGFRAGSKLFGVAAVLDVIAQALQFSAFVWLSNHYSEQWWSANYSHGGVEWLVLAGARILHGISMKLYGYSTFMLEAYHEDGTNEWHAVLNAFLFFTAACGEVFGVAFLPPQFGFIASLIAYLSAFFWSWAFEEVSVTSTSMEETELVNQVEDEVNKFADVSPYVDIADTHLAT